MRFSVTMKVRLVSAILLIVCGSGIGWLAFENLMWAIWGKHNSWFEYVGFWGCPIMIISGLIVLKSLRVGSILGSLGFCLMLFYLGPATMNTLHEIVVGNLVMNPQKILVLTLIIAFPLLTLGRLSLNIMRMFSAARA